MRNLTNPKYTKETLISVVTDSRSLAQVIRALGLVPAGGNYNTIKQIIKEFGIDTSHFTGAGWRRGTTVPVVAKRPLSALLVKNLAYSAYKLKNRLLTEHVKESICEICKNTVWCGKPIPLELHHIDGDSTNQELTNLIIICPNCHAQTEHYRGNAQHSAKRNNAGVPERHRETA